MEPGESPRDALVREIKEELAVTLDSATLTPVGFADGEGQERCPPIVILLYSGRTWSGDPCAMEGGSFDWFTRAEIAALDMPPLDYVLLRQLC